MLEKTRENSIRASAAQALYPRENSIMLEKTRENSIRASVAQALYLLHKRCVLLHRHCICCTDTASAAQALYLLHKHCICCTGTVSPAQALCSAAQALYLLHRHIYLFNVLHVGFGRFASFGGPRSRTRKTSRKLDQSICCYCY